MPEQNPPSMDYAPPVIHNFLSVNNELYRLGLVQWVAVIERWLERYAGFELFMDHADDFPLNQVVTCLQTFDEPPEPPVLANALSKLSFLSYRVRAHRRELYDNGEPEPVETVVPAAVSHVSNVNQTPFDNERAHPFWNPRNLSLQAFFAQGVTVWFSESAAKTEPVATLAWLITQYHLQQMIG